MTIFDASGTVDGASYASAFALVAKAVGATFAGQVMFLASMNTLQLTSGFFQGSSTFDWDYFIDAAATAAGGSTASSSATALKNTIGFFKGSSFFDEVSPFRIQGASFFSLFTVVDHQLPPIKAITMGPKTLQWLQLLQRGDLSIFISDRRTPIIPQQISYRLAQLRPDGSRKYVGPQGRTPVAGDVGEFYASGRAGESGQPGLWIIEWRYQRTSESEVQLTEMQFQVLDAVAIDDPHDLLVRVTKYGWS